MGISWQGLDECKRQPEFEDREAATAAATWEAGIMADSKRDHGSDARDEKARMLAGELYLASDPTLRQAGARG